jgi:hypothetical protein
MATKIAIALLLGALGGLLAAAGTRLTPTHMTSLDNSRAAFIVQTAWQGFCHR